MDVLPFLVLGISLAAADKEVPAELTPFVLPGHEVLDFAVGDLDGDGRADAVLVLKGPDEVQGKDDGETRRPLLLLIRQPDGRLKQARQNDTLVYCRTCGGKGTDAYDGISVGQERFMVSHTGPDWGSARTFAYDPVKKDWFLDREESTSVFADRDPVRSEKSSLTRQELGDFAFETFDPDQHSRRTAWRVVAARTYFYDRPSLQSKPRKAFLVRGDVIEGGELRDFVVGQFTNSNHETTFGYLLKKDLERLPARPR